MSVALALNAGAYVMLAADTRRTFYDASGTARGFRDDAVKMSRSDRIVVTGTGAERVLDLVAARVALLAEPSADAILDIIASERESFARTAAHRSAEPRARRDRLVHERARP